MRLSKLEAAMRLGVSPSTVDRMIQRGQLEAEKEPHGTRYKVWVLLDDEQTDEPGDSPPGQPVDESPDEPVDESPDEPPDEPPVNNDQSRDSPPPPPHISAQVEMATLRERAKSAEERAQTLEGAGRLPQTTPDRLGVEIPGDPAAAETEPTERGSTHQGTAGTNGRGTKRGPRRHNDDR